MNEMLESKIESTLRKKVRKKGGRCLKWVSPGTDGVPDRIVLMPGRKIYFVETKSPVGSLKPIQRFVHREMAKLGHLVRVINSLEDVQKFINEL